MKTAFDRAIAAQNRVAAMGGDELRALVLEAHRLAEEAGWSEEMENDAAYRGMVELRMALHDAGLLEGAP